MNIIYKNNICFNIKDVLYFEHDDSGIKNYAIKVFLKDNPAKYLYSNHFRIYFENKMKRNEYFDEIVNSLSNNIYTKTIEQQKYQQNDVSITNSAGSDVSAQLSDNASHPSNRAMLSDNASHPSNRAMLSDNASHPSNRAMLSDSSTNYYATFTD